VLDVDIQKFFDTIDHELLLLAVRKHCQEKWTLLYIERWLKTPIQHADGRIEVSKSGTPQGGVISPLLANLYLHYAFDSWMVRKYPSVKFERYADDIVIHCKSELESEELKGALRERLTECGLTLHPAKTKTVYCKDYKRGEQYPNVQFTFLGYTFQPRRAASRQGGMFTAFVPAVSREATKRLRSKLRSMRLRRKSDYSLDEMAKQLNPTVRGWMNYFCQYYQSALCKPCFDVEGLIIAWTMHKYRCRKRDAIRWLSHVRRRQPNLFAHWTVAKVNIGYIGRAG
jgi:group II intron reverse transcriptase/maturase